MTNYLFERIFKDKAIHSGVYESEKYRFPECDCLAYLLSSEQGGIFLGVFESQPLSVGSQQRFQKDCRDFTRLKWDEMYLLIMQYVGVYNC